MIEEESGHTALHPGVTDDLSAGTLLTSWLSSTHTGVMRGRLVPFGDRLYDAIETGKIRLDDLTPRIRELRNRQERLLGRRSELEAAMSDRKVELADLSTVRGYVSDLRNTLNESPLSERRAFIRSFVKEIIVNKTEVQLNYTLPLLPKGLAEERLAVLPIVRYGGR